MVGRVLVEWILRSGAWETWWVSFSAGCAIGSSSSLTLPGAGAGLLRPIASTVWSLGVVISWLPKLPTTACRLGGTSGGCGACVPAMWMRLLLLGPGGGGLAVEGIRWVGSWRAGLRLKLSAMVLSSGPWAGTWRIEPARALLLSRPFLGFGLGCDWKIYDKSSKER